MKVLVLEDSPQRVYEFRQRFLEIGWVGTFVDKAQEAIDLLKKKSFDIIFLDHDLGGETYVDPNNKNTGSEVARWLSENPTESVVIIHSLNAPAAHHMQTLCKKAVHLPYIWSEDRFKVIKPE